MNLFKCLVMGTVSIFLGSPINFLFSQAPHRATVTILYRPHHPANSLVPSRNIGGAIDGHFKGDIDKMLTPENIAVMKEAGLKPVSYRLRTELAGEVWHWNPRGKWSDSARREGYWISDTAETAPIGLSYGYRLPRRGNTHDQANDDAYSRITDGDTATFWKSNPYLDSFFTRESNALHPQWLVVDLGKKYRVNAIGIDWGDPYAIRYTVDYAKGNDPAYFDPFEPGIWHSFPDQEIDNNNRRNKVIKIAARGLMVRFIRISFDKSSGTARVASADLRDRLGFAIREIRIGIVGKDGIFHDDVRHSANHGQSTVYVSSTDPWHTSRDIDYNTEQPGIDRFFTDGVTSGLPALLPMAVLYDTPGNMLALASYLRARHYPFEQVEMGEEPEGQLVAPADYAALYFQLATRLRETDPNLEMGGPSFASLSSSGEDSTTFTEADWTRLFLAYLQRHDASRLFNFFSFEWYPFDDLCAPSAPQLIAAPAMLDTAMNHIRKILPAGIPMYVTEYGYSAYEGRPEVEMQGALMYGDILGKFLELGGKKSFLYGYEPAFLQQSSHCGFGNNMLLGLNQSGKIGYKTASFYTTRMITGYWARPEDAKVEVYPCLCKWGNRRRPPIISAYSLRAPSGRWSVMLINKDPAKTFAVTVGFENRIAGQVAPLKWAHEVQYGKAQYEWKAEGIHGHPVRNLPPVVKEVASASPILLPPFSLTVISE